MSDGLTEIAFEEHGLPKTCDACCTGDGCICAGAIREAALALEEAAYWLARAGVKRSVLYRIEDAYEGLQVWGRCGESLTRRSLRRHGSRAHQDRIKSSCRYPLPDGRACLECDACQEQR